MKIAAVEGGEGLSDINAESIAERFLCARRNASGLDDYPGEMPSSLEDSYKVQDAAIAGWQEPIVGWKVGRVPSHLQKALGSDRLAGPIFQSRPVNGDALSMPVFADGFAAGEAEFLLRIGRAPDASKAEYSLEEVRDCIDAIHVGIEIASSPLKTINELGPLAIVSDFGNNNGLVIGPEIENWASSDFENWMVSTCVDGRPVGTGTARDFPFGSAKFLLELLRRRGIAMQPGQWISSGAVTGVHEVRSGQVVEADFGGKLRVQCNLIPAEPRLPR